MHDANKLSRSDRVPAERALTCSCSATMGLCNNGTLNNCEDKNKDGKQLARSIECDKQVGAALLQTRMQYTVQAMCSNCTGPAPLIALGSSCAPFDSKLLQSQQKHESLEQFYHVVLYTAAYAMGTGVGNKSTCLMALMADGESLVCQYGSKLLTATARAV